MKVILIEKAKDTNLLVGQALLRHGKVIQSENWQSMGKNQTMFEMTNLSIEIPIPKEDNLIEEFKPNMPWALQHFHERVSGMPLNPGRTYKIWPFYGSDSKVRTENQKFSHTYMERFWPKLVNSYTEQEGIENGAFQLVNNPILKGIRYNYGDLADVIELLKREPTTRQAFLPIWFPEDTGAVHKQRVPCTLGYLFNINRDTNTIDITYYMRSCDYFRHFVDDIFLACKLLHYVKSKLELVLKLDEGNLYFHCRSMHIFSIEVFRLEKYINKAWQEKD